jgi:predicted RNA-binding Zn-ribbon protein involved in translation (DUF1610 family)
MDREKLIVVVASSKSYREVVLRMGMTSGSAWHAVKREIEALQLDVTHFLGRSANSGERHRGGPEKITAQNIHTIKRGVRTTILRRVLQELDREYRCVKCGNTGEWNGKPLELEIDHIDGNSSNPDPTNLRYLCPNCHALTPTHGFKGRHHTEESRAKISQSRRDHD